MSAKAVPTICEEVHTLATFQTLLDLNTRTLRDHVNRVPPTEVI